MTECSAVCKLRYKDYSTATYYWTSFTDYKQIGVRPVMRVDIFTAAKGFYPAASFMHPHTPEAAHQWEALSRKGTIQTPRNANTARSFLRSRKSSKSVWSCVFAPRLPPGGTPLIKPTDCILYPGELPQTGLYCELCVWECVCVCVCVEGDGQTNKTET